MMANYPTKLSIILLQIIQIHNVDKTFSFHWGMKFQTRLLLFRTRFQWAFDFIAFSLKLSGSFLLENRKLVLAVSVYFWFSLEIWRDGNGVSTILFKRLVLIRILPISLLEKRDASRRIFYASYYRHTSGLSNFSTSNLIDLSSFEHRSLIAWKMPRKML